MRRTLNLRPIAVASIFVVAAGLSSGNGFAQPDQENKLLDAASVLDSFTLDDNSSIPGDLLRRARGIAVIPDLIRGGFFVGGRRGKGVLVVRDQNGNWSNPAFITLTGGSIGWQFGAESADIVLIFANDRSVRNIAAGRFTIGGDASAVAGPVGRHNTAAVTFQSEIYAYVDSRGLFAGATLEGTRLGLDSRANIAFYGYDARTKPLGDQTRETPAAARRFLLTLEQASAVRAPARPPEQQQPAEAKTFPLGDGQ